MRDIRETDERAIRLGEYIVQSGATVRAAAKVFGISKSTVHKDVTERLEHIDTALWGEVKEVLERNKAQRHIRGGNATRRKYLERREAIKKRAAGKGGS